VPAPWLNAEDGPDGPRLLRAFWPVRSPQTSRLRPRTPNILASEWYGFQVSEISTGKTLVVSGVVITVMLRPQPGSQSCLNLSSRSWISESPKPPAWSISPSHRWAFRLGYRARDDIRVECAVDASASRRTMSAASVTLRRRDDRGLMVRRYRSTG
jgi:hypothetical protein